VPVLDGGDAQCDQRVGLPGDGGPDHAHVLAGPDPLQRREVVERRGRDRGGGVRVQPHVSLRVRPDV